MRVDQVARLASRARPCENQTTSPEQRRRISRTSGSSALSTAWPSRGTASTSDGLDVGELLEGVDAAQPEVVGLHVEDDGDVVALVAETLAQDAAAGDLEDREVDPRVLQHHPGADFGPEASARMTSRSSMTTPSVDVMPTLRPMPLKMCAIIRDVVVLPLVPVTATIGIRLGAPGGNSMSTTGLAMNCGSPDASGGCASGTRARR